MFYKDGKSGFLTVITGPMASEKSGELIQRCRKAEKYQRKNVVVFKPMIDNRFAANEVVSRIGLRIPCRNLPVVNIRIHMYADVLDGCDIVAIDEANFFDASLVDAVRELLEQGKSVLVSGLNMDYLGEPFGQLGTLMCMADEIVQKYAYCAVCGRPAIYTQRLCEGEPVTQRFESNIKVGDLEGRESYEPRCRLCFVNAKAQP